MLPGRCCHDSSSLVEVEWEDANGSIAAARAIQARILMALHRLNGTNTREERPRERKALTILSRRDFNRHTLTASSTGIDGREFAACRYAGHLAGKA